jgi:hypothetical protein
MYLSYRRLIRAINYPCNLIWINSIYKEEDVISITITNLENEFHEFTIDQLIENLQNTGFKNVIYIII